MRLAYATSHDTSNLPQKDGGETLKVTKTRDMNNMEYAEFKTIKPIDESKLKDLTVQADKEVDVPSEVEDRIKEIQDSSKTEDVKDRIKEDLEASDLDMSVNSFLEQKKDAMLDIGNLADTKKAHSSGTDSNNNAALGDSAAANVFSGVVFNGPTKDKCVAFRDTKHEWAFEPPDPASAVGEKYVVVMDNRCGAIYDKSSHNLLVGPLDLNVFFNAGGDVLADPFITFDKTTGRFFVTEMDVTAGGVYVATAKESTGILKGTDWLETFIPFRLDNNDPENEFLDQPYHAVSSDKFVVSGNLFADDFIGARSAFIDKTCLIDPNTACTFFYSDINPQVFSPHPVVTDSTDEDITIISSTPKFTDGSIIQNMLYVQSWTGPADNLDANAFLTEMNMADQPQGGVQPNTDTLVYSVHNDNRVMSAYETPNHKFIWLTFNDACFFKSNGGDVFERDCVRLIEMNKKTLDLVQDFNIGNSDVDTFGGGITVDGRGIMYVVFGQSAADLFPSLFAARQLPGTPINTLSDFLSLEIGKAFKNDPRYGDYFAASPDTDGTGAWLYGEFMPTNPENWGTKIGSVI